MAQLMSIKRNVEMCPGQVSVPAIYHVSQGDKGTRIILGLVNNSTNYTIPEGTTATIRGSRSDGTLFTEITADVETTEVKFNLTEDMSAVPGRAECEAVLASGSANIIGTANFIIDVEKSPASIGSVFPGTDAAETWLIDELTNLDISGLDDESVVDAINNKTNESTIAPEFDPSGSYTAGSYVLKNGVLYKFTADHSGAWTGTDAEEVTVSTELIDLKSAVEELESGSRGGLSSTQKQTLMDVINALGGAFTTPSAQSLIDAFNSAWNVAVTGITLNKSTLSFSALTSETLRATLSPSDATGTVTWVSSNTSVATVDSNGTVVAVGNGTATITASCGGYSAICAVTVSGIKTTYTVTYNLTGCESSNPQTRVEEGSAFTANITPVVGYLLPFIAYTVTMGSTDITASAWSDGVISIANVTGAIVISAAATVDSRTLLYAWDLTQSLVDTVNNKEATLINTVTAENLPTRDSNGLHFTEAGQVAQFVTLDEIASRVIEMDVASMDFKGDTSKHIRLLDNNFSNTAYSLLIRRNSGIWTAYENGWQTPTAVSGQTTLSNVNAFSGHTVSCEILSGRSMTVYVDGTPIYTIPVVYNFGRSIAVGGGPTGTQNDGQQIFDCTITGLRIYSI